MCVCMHIYIYIHIYITYIYVFIFLHMYIYIYMIHGKCCVWNVMCYPCMIEKEHLQDSRWSPSWSCRKSPVSPCISPALRGTTWNNYPKIPRWSHDWDSLGPTYWWHWFHRVSQTRLERNVSLIVDVWTSRPAKIAVPAKAAGVWQYESGCLREVNRFVLISLW